MAYPDYMALGLLPPANDQPVAYGRDVISEAHERQILLNLLFGRLTPDDMRAWRNTYTPHGETVVAHYGPNAPELTTAGAFAGHIVATAQLASSAVGYDELGVFDEVLGLLGLADDEDEDEVQTPEFDPFAHPSGVSTDPDMGLQGRPFFDEPFEAPAPMPPVVYAPGRNPADRAVYGWQDDTLAGLADALGPSITSVSRLGGPFAGYTPDALTARLRELVRRA